MRNINAGLFNAGKLKKTQILFISHQIWQTTPGFVRKELMIVPIYFKINLKLTSYQMVLFGHIWKSLLHLKHIW